MRQEAAETKALSLGTELEERSEGIKERSRRVEKMEDRLERKVKGQKQSQERACPADWWSWTRRVLNWELREGNATDEKKASV